MPAAARDAGESLADAALLGLGSLTTAWEGIISRTGQLHGECLELDRRVTSLEELLEEQAVQGLKIVKHDTIKPPLDEGFAQVVDPDLGDSEAVVPQGIPSQRGQLLLKAAAMAGYKIRLHELEHRVLELEQGHGEARPREPTWAQSSPRSLTPNGRARALAARAAEGAPAASSRAASPSSPVTAGRLDSFRDQLQSLEDGLRSLDATFTSRLEEMRLELSREAQQSQQVLEGRVKQAEAKASEVRREAKEDRDYCGEAVSSMSTIEQKLQEATSAARDALEVANMAREAAQEPAREAEAVARSVQAIEQSVRESMQELRSKVSEATLEAVRQDLEQTLSVHSKAIEIIKGRQMQQDACLAQTYRDLLQHGTLDVARTIGSNFQAAPPRRSSQPRPGRDNTPERRGSADRRKVEQAQGERCPASSSDSPSPSRPALGGDGNIYGGAAEPERPASHSGAAQYRNASGQRTSAHRAVVQWPGDQWPGDAGEAAVADVGEDSPTKALAAAPARAVLPSSAAARALPARPKRPSSAASTPALHWTSSSTIAATVPSVRPLSSAAALARPGSAKKESRSVVQAGKAAPPVSFASYVADKCAPLPALERTGDASEVMS